MNYRRLILPAVLLACIAAVLLLAGGPAEACPAGDACQSPINKYDYCQNCEGLRAESRHLADNIADANERYVWCLETLLPHSDGEIDIDTCIDYYQRDVASTYAAFYEWEQCVQTYRVWWVEP